MLFYTIVVSTLLWVTQGTPTGNHTCTGVVKHPVTVRVNVTEPVTYRSYTWCLRVPPRCSKYTVQLQDRVKIHTAMHNKTITVCCKGYVEMDYKCVPACPPMTDCPFMHCNRTNHCYCTPGYTGLYCNDPCARGFWGEHCMKECDCPSGYICHHLTGDCMLDDKPPSKIRRTTSAMPETTEKTETTTTKKSTIMTYPTTSPTIQTTQSTLPTSTTTTTTTTLPTTTTTTTEAISTTREMTTKQPTTSETVRTTYYTTFTPKTEATTSKSTIKTTQITEPSTYLTTEPTTTTESTTTEPTSSTTTKPTSTSTTTEQTTTELTTTESTTQEITKTEPTIRSTETTETTSTTETFPTLILSTTTSTTPLRTKESIVSTKSMEMLTSISTPETTTTTTTRVPTTTITTTVEPTTKLEITTQSTPTTFVTTEHIPITHEKSPYENLPPLMANRKKTTKTPEIHIESTTKEIEHPTTVVLTTRQTTEDNSIKIFAPIVPFPHHPRTKQETTTQITTEEIKLVPSTVYRELTKSPLDFLQPRRPQKPFESNSDNSISATRDSTTQKPLDSFIDTNKRLWEIFETGLNLKTTLEPTTTKNFVNFEQFEEINRPIKKSEIYGEETTIKTTLPVLEYEKETSAETSQKQPKHKEKYQKKHKSKTYDTPSSPQETTYTTESKSKINKYSKTTESIFENQETSERPTSSRPSHTWYSHAREKAKIKEAMKFKTTQQPDKSTESFDSDSNDINLMQTSFTEDSKNFQEDLKEQYLMANSFNLTRYSPSKITSVKSYYSDFIIVGASCIMMLSTLITLIWLRNNKKKRALSPGSSIVAYESQTETVSPLIYETVYPLNGGPELIEATTFFCPTFTNHYAERINRELSESSYDHPRRYNES